MALIRWFSWARGDTTYWFRLDWCLHFESGHLLTQSNVFLLNLTRHALHPHDGHEPLYCILDLLHCSASDARTLSSLSPARALREGTPYIRDEAYIEAQLKSLNWEGLTPGISLLPPPPPRQVFGGRLRPGGEEVTLPTGYSSTMLFNSLLNCPLSRASIHVIRSLLGHLLDLCGAYIYTI